LPFLQLLSIGRQNLRLSAESRYVRIFALAMGRGLRWGCTIGHPMIRIPLDRRQRSTRLASGASLLRAGVAGLLLGWAGFLAGAPAPEPPAACVGRPVRVVSLCFRPTEPIERVLPTVAREAQRGADLIVLPETWRGQNERSTESIDGPTVQALARLAAKHRTYIVTPLDLRRGTNRFNTAVLLDRAGKVAGAYDKVFPYWAEFDHRQPVEPGRSAPVFETDFGKLGLSICFDVNFPEVWQELDNRGAELVVWTSAYSAGTHLGAYAALHHFYVVTSTQSGDCQVYDITGERRLDERGDGIHVSRVTLDLDRGIYHTNFNEEGKARLLREHADEVVQEKWLEREQWFVLKAVRPGLSARALARQYGLEELRDYIHRSRRVIDNKRGGKLASPPAGAISERTP